MVSVELFRKWLRLKDNFFFLRMGTIYSIPRQLHLNFTHLIPQLHKSHLKNTGACHFMLAATNNHSIPHSTHKLPFHFHKSNWLKSEKCFICFITCYSNKFNITINFTKIDNLSTDFQQFINRSFHICC